MKLSDKMKLLRVINYSGMSSNAKVVGTVLTLAVVENKDFARLSRDNLMARSGVSGGALDRAMAELENSCVMYRVRTGRATIWNFNRVVIKGSPYSGFTHSGESDLPTAGNRNFEGSEFFGTEDDKCKAFDAKNKAG